MPGNKGHLQGLCDARHLLKCEWVPDIMIALSGGPLHFSELLSSIMEADIDRGWPNRSGVLHKRILASTLRRMELDKLVERYATEGVFPPSVCYQLTPVAREILQAFIPAAEWATRHPEFIEELKQRRWNDAG